MPQALHAMTGGIGLAFSTRNGGVSQGRFESLNLGPDLDDGDARVRENRLRFADAAGFDPRRAVMRRQLHTNHVDEVSGPGEGRFVDAMRSWPTADAITTGLEGVALVVLSADCLPILIWRQNPRRVAAVHAGWRGLLDGVLQATVAAVGGAKDQAAVIGPGIRACCFHTDSQLRSRFEDRFGVDIGSRRSVDLAGAARAALRQAGVSDSSIHDLDLCTACRPELFFSYRRDGVGGRQAAAVWLR